MRIKIGSFNEFVCVDVPRSVYDCIKDNGFLTEYIPAAYVSKVNDCEGIELWVECGDDFNFSNDRIMTTLSTEHIFSVIVVAGTILERKRQEKRLYQVHGAAVKIRDKSVAIIGGMSGIGKTTLALNLSDFPESSFIGDEKFIIDGNSLKILGGCLLSKSNLKTKIVDEADLAYETKPTNLGLVIFPIIADETELTAHRLTPLKLSWHLYEEASRDIKGLNFLLNNFSEAHNGFDTDSIMQQRLNDCRNIADTTPGYFLRGNLQKVSDFIYNFITSST